MATYWENSCSFGLRYVSWYKCLIVSLVFSHLGFWSGNLFLVAPFPDLCLLVPFFSVQAHNAIMDTRIVVQSHGDQTNDLSQNQFRLATCPTKQTLNTQTLTQVPGEISQGFTSLNLDSFVTKHHRIPKYLNPVVH